MVEKSIPELQATLAAGAVTSRRLVELYLARIEAYDRKGPRLAAMIGTNPGALAAAQALDRERAERGPRGPLHGIPIVIKDNFETADMPTSGGSLALATLRTGKDAFQVRRLREAGAVILGKTNLHELASGITSVSSLGGQTRNPYDPLRNPGGSSGGTGAAVAASFAAAGMGSDTCGSIRIPASHNNLVGLRSTLGVASRSGIIPLSHTQDVGGPLARNTTDLAILLDATVGPDPEDPTTELGAGRAAMGFQQALRKEALRGARIGVLKSLFGDAPEDEEVAAVVRKALEEIKKQGAETPDVDVPGLAELLRDSSVIDAEFKFDLADYLARQQGAQVRSLPELLERGLYDTALEATLRRRAAVEQRDSEVYRKALVKRRAVRDAVQAVLDEHRLAALAYPTIRRKPAPAGEPQRGSNCQLSAASGLPALSLPAGFTDDGLPVGLELLGPAFADAELLGIAYAFEQQVRHRRAPFSTPPLVAGKPPAVVAFETRSPTKTGVGGRFRYDVTTGMLAYDVSVVGVAPAEILAAAIHRGAESAIGAVIVRVLAAGESAGAGSVTLSQQDRERLREGRLWLRLYTLGQPTGTAAAPLRLP